jgi:hypothetical protein
MAYTTTPELLQTVAAVATPLAHATVTTSGQSVPIPTETGSVPTGTGSGLFPHVVLSLSVAMGVAAFLI